MARKAVIWTVTDVFERDGVVYEEGDEWVQPANWKFDQRMSDIHSGRPAFTHSKLVDKKKEEYQFFTSLLPVELKE